MKSMYYFIRQPEDFGVNDVVYVVSVGTGRREQVKYELLRCYAEDIGAYFKPVSEISDIAVENLAARVFPKAQWPLLYLREVSISVDELYRLAIDDSWYEVESVVTMPAQYFRALFLFNSAAQLPQFAKRKKDSAMPSRRKNLKSAKRVMLENAGLKCGLILVLFLIGALL